MVWTSTASVAVTTKKILPKTRRVRTPTVLQMEAVECGAAALGSILAYHGRIVPLPELRYECGVSRDGSKASNMIKAAKMYGMEAKGFKKELAQLAELKLPYIVFWHFNHFVVVDGLCGDRVYINDPGSGPRQITAEEFDEGYTGVVLTFEPGIEFQKQGHKGNMVAALWKRLRGSTGALLYCMVTGLFLTMLGMVIPVFSQIFVDDILIEGRRAWLFPLLWSMGIAGILQAAITLLRLRYLRKLRVKLHVGMSSRFLWHILRLPMSFYAQRYAGEISNRAHLNDFVADILSGKLATTAIDSLMVILYAAIMVQYDWVLTAIIVGFAAINAIVLQKISRQRIDANQKLMLEQGKAIGVSIAALQSIETLKASALESDFFGRWSGYYTKALNSQQTLEATNQTFSVLPVLLSALSAAGLLVVGGLRVMDGHLSIGMLIAFQGLMLSFQQPVNNLVSFATTLQELEGDLVRLDDVLDNPIDPILSSQHPTQQNTTLQYAVPKLQGRVELRQLTFGYSRLAPALITDFNLTIQPGQRVALVGSSGSGKSTVAKLVSGLYQPWAGEVLFDDRPRSTIPHHILTNSISMVEQDVALFGGTIRDNLTLWDTTILQKQIQAACADAAIDSTILALSSGYDSLLNEGGANLSGGQRQRLEIARALVSNPSILVMDEATSALDAETEQSIDGHLHRRGCTCIIVAHRLSTIRDCDEIIVFDRGKVVQRGTHQSLWSVPGIYAKLISTEGGT
ncbi:MAG: NHLP family bacteriocin export ABC transporter peptidase/permease/ATPase subunit [Chamaesiphon sp.]|nr:NHLP family bacteriocin export ABC transporter peptidase/permease/ATPase subunit [Chamaesiphon sp.]